MIKFIDHTKMGRGQHDWLDSHFHFSFAEYYNPSNMHFGVLRVLNDDMVQPGEGFDTHPHQNMEILSYVVRGELTHGDSMGNTRTLTRGQVQYMSAGTGVLHSEHNRGKDLLRFLQIWIIPDKKDYTPNYGDYEFKMEDRTGLWLPLAASAANSGSAAPIKIHQDINFYAALIPAGHSLDFTCGADRQAYLVQIEGRSELKGADTASAETVSLGMRDAAEITGESFTIQAGEEDAHAAVLEMAR
jgi:redox-sensitive bicupin YhaK (pirin superfamily)